MEDKVDHFAHSPRVMTPKEVRQYFSWRNLNKNNRIGIPTVEYKVGFLILLCYGHYGNKVS